jgi:hypothetical protein
LIDSVVTVAAIPDQKTVAAIQKVLSSLTILVQVFF